MSKDWNNWPRVIGPKTDQLIFQQAQTSLVTLATSIRPAYFAQHMWCLQWHGWKCTIKFPLTVQTLCPVSQTGVVQSLLHFSKQCQWVENTVSRSFVFTFNNFCITHQWADCNGKWKMRPYPSLSEVDYLLKLFNAARMWISLWGTQAGF